MKHPSCARSLQLIACMVVSWVSCSLLSNGGELPASRNVGPFGPEGPRMREQLWLLPSGSDDIQLRATVFQPPDDVRSPIGGNGRRPVVIINHGTSEITRHSLSMPVFYWLSRWFVERGYVVVLPQRRGHGATGGDLVEARGTCSNTDHETSGRLAADDIEAVVKFISKQSFVAPNATVVLGISTGGWASLALATRNLPEVQAIVNFAGGRGGHAFGVRSQICGEQQLVEAAARFGSETRSPTLWLYSSNDSYFGPTIAKSLHSAWVKNGGRAELHVLPPYGDDGHTLADDRAGWEMWGGILSGFLARHLEPRTSAVSTNLPVPDMIRFDTRK